MKIVKWRLENEANVAWGESTEHDASEEWSREVDSKETIMHVEKIDQRFLI